MFWDKIDAVYIINLQHRKDRWDSIMERLSGFVPASKIQRIDAILGVELPGYGKPPWFRKRTGNNALHRAGAAGAVLSHKKALEQARQMGHSNVLILEDDAGFNDHLLGNRGNLIADFITENQWDILYLGFIEGQREVARVCGDADTGFIERTCGLLTGHAYLVNSTAYDKFLKNLPDEHNVWSWIAFHWAIDVWLRNWFAPFNKVYRCYPCVIDQAVNISDIEGGVQDWYSGTEPEWILYENEKRLERKIAFLKIINPIYYTRKGGKRWLGARFLGYLPKKPPKRK
uniref:Glycosyltransferase involved in LPS biosynthesis, GR25 family n=1 Tax=Candidatus Kentrum sp. FW TaxID=2126338 RepID=A0A450S4A6_9GAMM|nr:MAG: Glycosyltransferase involved in LPS biosynthesis, GR25 family [Candidatus Kentron sp. FW]